MGSLRLESGRKTQKNSLKRVCNDKEAVGIRVEKVFDPGTKVNLLELGTFCAVAAAVCCVLPSVSK